MIENRLKLVLIAVVLSAACHRGSSTMQREQKSYEVVSEGQAAGVSSTINAPGETVPPLTNTSADTTSNFTLAPNVDATGTLPPGTIAGTLPATGPVSAMPMPQMPRPAAPPARTLPPPPRVSEPPQSQPAPPPQTDTSTTTAPPPPQTDTTETEEQEPQEEPPPQPPPTQTDTRGW
jgi:hypothetical protein